MGLYESNAWRPDRWRGELAAVDAGLRLRGRSVLELGLYVRRCPSRKVAGAVRPRPCQGLSREALQAMGGPRPIAPAQGRRLPGQTGMGKDRPAQSSALLLFDLTGDPHWHDVFLEDSCLKETQPDLFVWGQHVQRDAAFAYARLPRGKGDSELKRKAVLAIEAQADKELAYARDNAFNITTTDRYHPMFIGFYSTPDAAELVRAHFLTGKTKYLAGAVQATQFAAGCNPINMTYTVGVGSNWTLHPLHLDSRRTGQPAPEGLTVYGNLDFERWNDEGMNWPMKWFLGKECVPSAYEWPIPEAYWDIFMYPMINEFTVDRWWPNIYVWGYLHARR